MPTACGDARTSFSMKRNRKELLVSCGIALLLMLVVPGAFRVWMAFNPQPVAPGTPVSSLRDATSSLETGRAMLLLRKPIDAWTTPERDGEPGLFTWLGTHAKMVLPWEWSSVARKKDPDGYCRLWRKLLEEQHDDLDRSLRGIRRQIRELREKIEDETILYAHATNESARLSAWMATNSYPATVETERLSKGRLWGWNRDEERHALADASAAHALLNAIVSNGVVHAECQQAANSQLREKEADEQAHVKLLADVEASMKQVEADVGNASSADDERIRLLLRLVRYIKKLNS